MQGVRLGSSDVPIERIEVAAYVIPTDAPEADGTIAWDSTTLVVVHVEAGGCRGLGYGYADERPRADQRLTGARGDAGRTRWRCRPAGPRCAAQSAIRGAPGICSMAISAVDVALWDLKARLLGVPLVTLFGAVRAACRSTGAAASLPIRSPD